MTNRHDQRKIERRSREARRSGPLPPCGFAAARSATTIASAHLSILIARERADSKSGGATHVPTDHIASAVLRAAVTLRRLIHKYYLSDGGCVVFAPPNAS